MSTLHKKLDRRKWAAARRACFDRDGWRCVKCSKAGRLECHHVRGLDRGGDPFALENLERGGDPFALENLETLCLECHINLSVFPPRRAWRDYQKQLTKEYEK